MRVPGLLIAGVAALVVGIVGLAVVAPAGAASPGAWGGWGFTTGGMMGPSGRMGPGAMGGMGAMMDPEMMGSGMLGGMGTMMGGPLAATARPLGIEDAARTAERAVQSLGNPDLAFDEVHSFAYNFSVPVYEKSTGAFAFELVIDRFTGATMPEMGPTMVWNTKYGMMAGAAGGMGGVGPGGMPGGQPPTVDTPIARDQAVRLAQQFLDAFLPGTMTGAVHDFYGYRTIHVERDGRVQGMISVNGSTGAVWYHTWHGDFLEGWQRPA